MVNWIVVYTTSAFECPWCIRLKELLKVYGFDYYEKDIHENEEWKKEFIAAGHRTVPQLYLEANLIGGYDKSKEYIRKRFLDKYDEKKRAEILEELEKIE